jgi:Tol biopolymer transport system component
MGTVYRAHDPDLDRDVALKLIHTSAVADLSRLQSFEKEARAAAALTHPNLVTIHDVGVSECGPFLVHELLEGETLQARLRKGDLTVRKAVDFGIQLAEGLAAAHAKGIVHRDLKTSNVFVTREGRVKILDFGLAQLQTKVAPASEDQPTASSLSDPLSLQGTAGYIAPEVVLGRPADARSDIFSLGVVLYEMLAGRRPFVGPSPAAAIMAAVADDPERLSTSRVTTALRAVVEHCLEKRPEERFESVRDVALALRAVTAEEPRSYVLPAVLSAIAAAAIAIGVFAWRRRVAATAPPAKPEFAPITSTSGVLEIHPALSPDGASVAYASDERAGHFEIYSRQLGSGRVQRLTQTEDFDCCPAWSRDGQAIAFIRVLPEGGEIRVVRATGADESTLVRRIATWFGSGVAWLPDADALVYSDLAPGATRQLALFRHDLATGEALQLTTLPPEAGGDAFPSVSADGTVAFARLPDFGDLMSADLMTVPGTGDARAARRVAHVKGLVGGLAWAPDGREIVYSSAGFNERVRLSRVAASSGATVLMNDPIVADGVGAEAFAQVGRLFRISVAPKANLLAYAASDDDTNIWRADLGNLAAPPVELIRSSQSDEAPQYSPDGKRIAFASGRATAHNQVWVCDADGQGCERVTGQAGPCGTPRWSPDSQKLAVDCTTDGRSKVFVVELGPNASFIDRLSKDSAFEEAVASWSRDGRFVYYSSERATGESDVWKREIGSAAAPVRITFHGGQAAFEAPDGRTVYYSKRTTGGLFAVDPASGVERQVSTSPRCWGYWAMTKDGVIVGDMAREGRLTVTRFGFDGTAHLLGDVPGTWACGESGLSVGPDGRSLLYVAVARRSDLMLMRNFR